MECADAGETLPVISPEHYLFKLLDQLVSVPGVIILRYVYRNRKTTVDPDGWLVPTTGLLAWIVGVLLVVLAVKMGRVLLTPSR